MQTETKRDTQCAAHSRRRRYVVNPHFQWKYAGWLMGAVFTASTSLAVILLLILEDVARARVFAAPSAGIIDALGLLVGFGVGSALVTAAAFGAWSFLLTHRICGPLYVISGYLRELREGKFPICRPLRKDDEFKEFYEEFAQTVAALRDRRQNELASVEQMLSTLAAAGAPSATHAELADLAAQIADLRDQTARDLAALAEPCSAGAPSAS